MLPLAVWVLAVPPGSTPILDDRLHDLLRQARQAAPDLAVVAARLEMARVAARAAGAERLPKVDALLSAGRGKEASGPGEAGMTNQYRTGLELSWEVDLWGRLARVRDAAVREAEAAGEDLRHARLLLESEVVSADAALRLLEAANPHHEARQAEAEKAVALHQLRVEAGVERRTEVHRARMEAQQVRAEAATHRRSLVLARQRLAMLTGKGADWTPPSAQVLKLPDLPPGAESTLLEARPDLQAALRRYEAAQSRIGEAKAARLPRFSLTGAYGFASAELRNLTRSRSATWSLLPSVSLPLLDGGRSRIRVEAARSEAREAEALLRQAQHRALHEAAEGLRLLEADRKHLDQEVASLQDAERLHAARQAERNAGRIGGLDLTEAALERHTAALRVLEARGTLAQTRVLLQRALGQPWVP